VNGKEPHTTIYSFQTHGTYYINWYTTTEKLEFLFRFEMDKTILNNS